MYVLIFLILQHNWNLQLLCFWKVGSLCRDLEYGLKSSNASIHIRVTVRYCDVCCILLLQHIKPLRLENGYILK